MKKLTILALFLGMTSMATGEISTRVCLADGNTPLGLADPNIPFVYRDIMVGTKLTIIVDSNTSGKWDSDLSIEGEYRDYGFLSARDYNDITNDWQGSRFEAAGYQDHRAHVLEWEEPGIQGFYLESGTTTVPGDWFIIDYTATNIGVCKIGFYDRSVSWDYPVYYHVFSHATHATSIMTPKSTLLTLQCLPPTGRRQAVVIQTGAKELTSTLMAMLTAMI